MSRLDLDELVDYRIKKARKTFSEVKLLIENELWNTAVNRLYYACYYAVIALLLSKGIKAQSHSGVRQMFGLNFIKTNIIEKDLGKFYTDIFDKRQTGDYDDFIDFKKDDVMDLLEPANKLITKDRRAVKDVEKNIKEAIELCLEEIVSRKERIPAQKKIYILPVAV